MKKWLKIMFAMNFSVSLSVLISASTKVVDNEAQEFLKNVDIDLYSHYDFIKNKNPNVYIEENIKEIVEDNFQDYTIGKKILNSTEFIVENCSDYSVTLTFRDKDGYYCLGHPVTIKFDVFLYNYDRINNFIKLIEKTKMELVLPVLKKNEQDFNNLISKDVKEKFNKLANKRIFLNDEKNFFDYLVFDHSICITNNGSFLKADFLNSSIVKFNYKLNTDFLNDKTFKSETIFKEEDPSKAFGKILSKYTGLVLNEKHYEKYFEIIGNTTTHIEIKLNENFFTGQILVIKLLKC